jgi:hydroxyacylglutathione hydrolase
MEWSSAAVLVTGFPSLVTATNCWVIAPGPGEQCVIVDPGIGVEGQLNEVIAENRLHPVAVLLTHGHLDHTFSVFPVCQARGIPAYIHSEDRAQMSDPWSPLGMPKGSPLMGMTNLSFAEPDEVLELTDASTVALAGLEFGVRHAPGHTRGSMVFGLTGAEDELLFSGDVLFAGSIGRVDLPGGSMAEMLDSLRRVVLPLADDIVVHAGHGPSTTIGRERRTNPYLVDLA